MTMTFAKLTGPCLIALSLASACTAESDYCVETVTVLESLDSPTPAGVTPAEIFGVIGGTREAELEYVEPGGGSVYVEIEPGGAGTTALTLELTRNVY